MCMSLLLKLKFKDINIYIQFIHLIKSNREMFKQLGQKKMKKKCQCGKFTLLYRAFIK